MNFVVHLKRGMGQIVASNGSVYGFWCFSFERYNGTMGKYHSNNHSIILQTKRKMVTYSHFLKDDAQNAEEVEMDDFHEMIGLQSKFGKIKPHPHPS